MDFQDDDVFPPIRPNWAQRAAAVAGKGKGAKAKPATKADPEGGKASGTTSGKSAPAVAAPGATKVVSPCKLRISTLGGARVRREDLSRVMASFLAEKGPAPVYNLSGSVFGKSYAIEFKGGAAIATPLVRATLDSLKQPDGSWRKLFCPSPLQGEPEIQLFLNPDRDPTKLLSDFHFRCLKRSVQKQRHDPT